MRLKRFITQEDANALISSFWKWTIISEPVNYEKLTIDASKAGILIQEGTADGFMKSFIKSNTINPNSTFYRLWSDVEDRDRHELLVDQIMHYMTTYGTDFQSDAFVPNKESLVIPYHLYTKILECSKEDMYNTCIDTLLSGAAISNELLTAVVDYILYYIELNNISISDIIPILDEMKNKDGMAMLSYHLNILPNNPDQIIRVLFYMIFKDPTPIMSKQNMEMLYAYRKYHVNIPDLNALFDEDRLINFSRHMFRRYKKFLLGLKTPENKNLINRMKRESEKKHYMLSKGFWGNITNNNVDEVNRLIANKIDDLDNNTQNNMLLIRVLYMLRLRKMQNIDRSCRIYKIRNHNIWVDKDSFAAYDPSWDYTYDTIYSKLVERLETRRKEIEKKNHRSSSTVHFGNIHIAAPRSLRLFAGNYPEGSYIEYDENAFIGIYWEDNNGQNVDLDLHLKTDNGGSYGWCYSYADAGVTYSGDMTSSHDGASEVFKIGKGLDANIYVSVFSGPVRSNYQTFFGRCGNIEFSKDKYMVDPNDIQIRFDTFNKKKSEAIARVVNSRIYPLRTAFTESPIADISNEYNKSISDMLEANIDLEQLLLDAGYILFEEKINVYNEASTPNYDFSQPTKDLFLTLL